MNELLQQLLQMGPGIGAGLSGNGPAMQAFMDGYMKTQQMLQQQGRLKQQDQFAQEDRTREIERQKAGDARVTEDRGRRQALEELQLPGILAEHASSAETPQDAQRMIEAQMPNLMQVFGQETMAAGMPAVDMATRTITGRQKKQVEAFVEQALKTSHVADNPDTDPEIQLPEHLTRILGKPSAKLSELQSFAQLPVGKPAGKTRVPAMPGSQEDFIARKYGDAPTAEQILEGRRLYSDAGREPDKAQPGGYPPNVQRRIDAVIKGFDAQPIVKRTQVMSEGVNFAQSLDDNTTNPADDQALIYAFAKVMDPDSVVREGEYATVQKYAQSWAERFGFDVKRIFSNTSFLTPEARRNMKATLMTKFGVERKAYDNIRNEYGKRIDRITSKTGGIEELTDYGAAFPQAPAQQPPPAAATSGPQVGERRKSPNGDLIEWDGKGWKIVRM